MEVPDHLNQLFILEWATISHARLSPRYALIHLNYECKYDFLQLITECAQRQQD